MYKIVHQATCKFLGINEGYKLVMDEMYEIGRFIEKFEYEYSKICVISTKLQTLIISNRKIAPNCCLPASFHEVLVNYASNMIRIRLNNCTIFWKQREFLHGLDNLQKLVSVGAIRRFIFSFFANQNFSRDRKAELLCKSIALVLQVKFRFMGCLVKANALVSGNR